MFECFAGVLRRIYMSNQESYEIKNEILYEIIKNLDDESKMIIELKYQGYFVWEIAKITKLSIDQINYKIKKIRKMFKSYKKTKYAQKSESDYVGCY